jgi:inosine-uridine nucleoside N-ribohydrolase
VLKRIIIDTDAANEIDDQYAIAYAVLSGKFDICGLTATHFGKQGSMGKSYEEIIHVINLLGKKNEFPVYRGAPQALSSPEQPVDSPAARFIIDEALKSNDKNLHVLSIGPLTNLASAYLLEPDIKDRIKALWLAGKAWPEGGLFFNNRNDITAAQIIFDSGIDLTLIPAYGTADRLKVHPGDRGRIKGKGDIGDYLWKLFMKRWGLPKSIYDVTAIEALMSFEWCTSISAPRPALMKNGKYDHSNTKGQITVITDINAKEIKKNFFKALNKAR